MATRLYLAVGLFLAAMSSAQSPVPDFCLKLEWNDLDEQFYRAREGGRYCDGLTYKRHSAADGTLPLIAVTTGSEGWEPSENTVEILALANSFGSMRLQGKALEHGVNYQFDSKLSEGELTFRFGRNSGLSAVPGLDRSSVGWIAWAENDRGQLYVPVLDPTVSASEIVVTVRPKIHSSAVVYTLADAEGCELISQTAAKWDVRANTNVTISIPAFGSSPVFISAAALGKEGDREFVGFYLERKPSISGQ